LNDPLEDALLPLKASYCGLSSAEKSNDVCAGVNMTQYKQELSKIAAAGLGSTQKITASNALKRCNYDLAIWKDSKTISTWAQNLASLSFNLNGDVIGITLLNLENPSTINTTTSSAVKKIHEGSSMNSIVYAVAFMLISSMFLALQR
jgi:hypothetical protein